MSVLTKIKSNFDKLVSNVKGRMSSFLVAKNDGESKYSSTKSAGCAKELCPLQPYSIPSLPPVSEAQTSPVAVKKHTDDCRKATIAAGKNMTFAWESGVNSTRPHWPPNAESGVTVGAGYDMGGRSPETVKNDLIRAGVGSELAKLLSGGAGKKGADAEKYLGKSVSYDGRDVRYDELQISKDQEKALYEITYPWYVDDAKRIATKADVTEKYGVTDWEALDPSIAVILADMRFRGDYSPDSRNYIAPGDSKRLQDYVAANDVQGFRRSLSSYHAKVVSNADPKIQKGLRNRFDSREAILSATCSCPVKQPSK